MYFVYNIMLLLCSSFIDSGKIKTKVPARFSDDYPDDGPIEEEGDYSTLASTYFGCINLLYILILF